MSTTTMTVERFRKAHREFTSHWLDNDQPLELKDFELRLAKVLWLDMRFNCYLVQEISNKYKTSFYVQATSQIPEYLGWEALKKEGSNNHCDIEILPGSDIGVILALNGRFDEVGGIFIGFVHEPQFESMKCYNSKDISKNIQFKDGGIVLQRTDEEEDESVVKIIAPVIRGLVKGFEDGEDPKTQFKITNNKFEIKTDNKIEIEAPKGLFVNDKPVCVFNGIICVPCVDIDE